MRSKAPLALMEQAVMVLVFALAAALCLRVFVWSDQASKRAEARDRAAVAAQTVAEVIKNEGRSGMNAELVLDAAAEALNAHRYVGFADRAALELYYGSDWSSAGDGDCSYVLRAGTAGTGDPDGLSMVRVWVTTDNPDDTIFEITVAWQNEVGGI